MRNYCLFIYVFGLLEKKSLIKGKEGRSDEEESNRMRAKGSDPNQMRFLEISGAVGRVSDRLGGEGTSGTSGREFFWPGELTGEGPGTPELGCQASRQGEAADGQRSCTSFQLQAQQSPDRQGLKS